MIQEILTGFGNFFDIESYEKKAVLSYILIKEENNERFLYNLYWMGPKQKIVSDDWYNRLMATEFFSEALINKKYVLSIFVQFVQPHEDKYNKIRDQFREYFLKSSWNSKVINNTEKYAILEELSINDLIEIMEDGEFQSLRSAYQQGLFSVYPSA